MSDVYILQVNRKGVWIDFQVFTVMKEALEAQKKMKEESRLQKRAANVKADWTKRHDRCC